MAITIPKSELSSPEPTPSLSDSPEVSPPRKTVTIRYECEVCEKVFVFTLEYTTPDDLKGVADAVIFCSVCAEIALKDFLLEKRRIQKVGAFLEKYPNAECGAAHVVLSDYNFDSIDFCLNEIATARLAGGSSEELDATEAFLNVLKDMMKEFVAKLNS